MPHMYTPINCLEILQSKRLILILWYIDELMKDHQVIGQVSIPMGLFKEQPPIEGNRNPSSTDP